MSFTPYHVGPALQCGEKGALIANGCSSKPWALTRGTGFTRTVTTLLDRWLKIEPVYAHCDVPCGIYDPHQAAIAAKTIYTMGKKLSDLPPAGPSPKEQLDHRNTVVRMVQTKEAHAQICKQELLILWSDYFKAEHLAMFPDLHETFWKAAKLCSFNKQHVDVAKAQELMDAVARISDMFNKAEAAKKK